uniref:Uncharacterized protein n=1 Tax=Cacopsylla melanoneura TaxID=428564 RepID=A0A8D8QG36_9HEMI
MLKTVVIFKFVCKKAVAMFQHHKKYMYRIEKYLYIEKYLSQVSNINFSRSIKVILISKAIVILLLYLSKINLLNELAKLMNWLQLKPLHKLCTYILRVCR